MDTATLVGVNESRTHVDEGEEIVKESDEKDTADVLYSRCQ